MYFLGLMTRMFVANCHTGSCTSVRAPARLRVNVYNCSSCAFGAFVFVTMPRRKADAQAPNDDAGETVPKKKHRAKRAPRASPALAAPGPPIDQQLQQQQQQQQDMPAPNSDAGQTVPNRKTRAQRAPRGSPTLAITRVPTDQQVQQQQQQQQHHSQLEQPQQQQPQPQQARQLQPKQPAETTRPKVEEDASSEASTLVLGASPSPSRFTSPDAGRAVVDPVVVSSTAVSAAAPPPPKRQRARNDGAAAPHRRSSAAAPNSDPGGQSTSTAAPATTVVQHAVVSPKTGRAKPTVARCQRVFPKDMFLKRAGDAREDFLQDLANKRFQYPLPFIGAIACEFVGKTNNKNCHEIFATDGVVFRWSYICTPRSGIQIKGFIDSHYIVRSIAFGALPPRASRVMLDAVVVAKLYEKLSPELCPFVRKYCARKELDVAECEVLRIGSPMQLTQMPHMDDFVDASGASGKWIRCASIGDTDMSICHPGASARYSTNRLIYNVSDLRVFNIKDKKEATPELFKLRKRTAIRKDKLFTANLDDVNYGAHRGVRYVIAYGIALSEFELANHEKRNVSLANAMKGFDLDPFTWEESVCPHMVVVLWRSADGKHHLQTGNLRYLLGLITKTGQEQEAEATASIIEAI